MVIDVGTAGHKPSGESAEEMLREGIRLTAANAGEAAMVCLLRSVEIDPDRHEGWLWLSKHQTATGDHQAARQSLAEYLRASSQEPLLRAAARALARGSLPEAEFLVREHLREHGKGARAFEVLAECMLRQQRDRESRLALEQCLALEPGIREARFHLAALRYRAGETAAARAELDSLLGEIPHDPACRALLVAVLSNTADVLESLPVYEDFLASYPHESRLWMSYAHILKAAGRQADSVQAYREAIRLRPANAESWWSLANLKTVRLDRADVAAMEAQLELPGLGDEDRLHFHFALGKALEDIGDFADSFRHYAAGNALRLSLNDYSADAVTTHVQATRKLMTRSFFASRAGWGCKDPAPIFIVGLPRAGSTLVEQILASHPMVEGTMELINVTLLARSIAERSATPGDHDYLPQLSSLGPDDFEQLGLRFLADTRVHRAKGCRHFIDKMPNNFGHVGLIHLMLPNARIVDARRHPLGCCFSNFKQHYSVGQQFSYGLEEVGRYYRDYVELMAHYDEVLPGRVHRVFYEQMVADTEIEVRRLLNYCQLPFDERCLRFFENQRTVRTASSEQVRKPIYRDGVDHWLRYEQWLDPLKAALGPVLDAYPAVPEFPLR